ncbi:MAG: hypothetical protein JOZ18_15715 [Chloroflexi bacterium]|nr:hypothetical protein [Chloroflexota bacterium]
MNAELEQRLHTFSKEQLIQLLQELALHHPDLRTEMLNILQGLPPEAPSPDDASPAEDIDEEVTEDWDFSGDDQAVLRSFLRPVPLSPSGEGEHQRVEEFASRLRQEESAQALAVLLTELVEEAISQIGYNNYRSALDLFALLIDERLLERTPATTPVFDEMIDAASSSLEAVLSEASSSTMFDADTAALSPLLTTDIRQRWLERLFALWLKRLDAHKVEENLPEVMLDVAWNEDLLLLRSLAQNELQKQPYSEHHLLSRQESNIVDFTLQYRTKALEKFLKALPRT